MSQRRSVKSPRRVAESNAVPSPRSRSRQLAQILDLPDEELRGVPLPALLANHAWLFKEGGAAARSNAEEVYAMSTPVARIDFFISHAWRSPRYAKCLALWETLNIRAALTFAMLINLVIFWVALHLAPALTAAVKLPMVSFVDRTVHETLVLSALPCAFLGYMTALATAHRQRREVAFLDIACVSQTDAAKQAQGISALGAVLARSEKMVMLVDEHCAQWPPSLALCPLVLLASPSCFRLASVALCVPCWAARALRCICSCARHRLAPCADWRRLWCVFEVAAFCRHAHASRLVVLPLHRPILELGFAVYTSCLMAMISLLGTGDFNQTTAPVTFLVPMLCIVQPPLILAYAMSHRSREALNQVRDLPVIYRLPTSFSHPLSPSHTLAHLLLPSLNQLSNFRIEDAECYSDADRQALVSVISEWYTDRRAGEDEPSRLAALGARKFENFVRNDLAPSIRRQQGDPFGRMNLIVFAVAVQGVCLALVAAPSVSVHHAAMLLVVFSFVSLAVRASHALAHPCARTHACSPHAALPIDTNRIASHGGQMSATMKVSCDFAAALIWSRRKAAVNLASFATFIVVGLVGLVTYLCLRKLVATPNQFLSPAWTAPSDGFEDDPETRRHLKHYLVLGWHLLALVAAGLGGR